MSILSLCPLSHILSFNMNKILTFIAGIAVIAAVAFAFFYPDAMQGNELRQHDMQQGVANSHELLQHMEQTGEV